MGFTATQPLVPGADPGTLLGANNGLSTAVLGSDTYAQLGQPFGAAGDPAALLSDRYIPMEGFNILMTGLGNLVVGAQASTGDRLNVNGSSLFYDNSNPGEAFIMNDITGVVPGSQTNGITMYTNTSFSLGLYMQSDQLGANGQVILSSNVADEPFIALDTPNVTGGELGVYMTGNGFMHSVATHTDNGNTFQVGGSATVETNLGVGGVTSMTAQIQASAQTTVAGTAPLKLTLSSAVMATPEAGAIEGTLEYPTFTSTTGPARRPFLLADAVASLVVDRIPFFATGGNNLTTASTLRYSASNNSLGVGAAPNGAAYLVLGANTSGRGGILFITGTLKTILTAGLLEYNQTNLFFTPASLLRWTLAKSNSGTGNLNFGSTAAQSSADLTVSVLGAQVGDLAIVNDPFVGALANCCFTAFVSTTDTVTVRFNNYSAAPIDPGAANFVVSVISYL